MSNMIKYRKNSNWKTATSSASENRDIDEKIQIMINKIFIPENSYIDIIDISIRSTNIPETKYSISKEKHYITIFYAIIENDKVEI